MNNRYYSNNGSQRYSSGSNNRSDAPVVYTDGACSNNGRATAAAGYGVYWGDGHPDNVSAPVSGAATNNRAEYEAVLTAMNQARDRGHSAITVRTDSKLLVDSMDNYLPKWKSNDWKTSTGEGVRNRDLLEAIDDARKDVQVQFQHVNGHSAVHGNEMADQLARQGAKKYGGKKY